MAPAAGGVGAGAGAGASPGVRAACLAGASAAAVLALWLAWPRRPRASREQALAALRRLREECVAVYAEVAACASAAGLPEASSSASTLAAGDLEEDGEGEEEEEGAKRPEETALDRLKQAVEQPLVLAEALREAAALAAEGLPAGGSAEDLEAELQRFSADEEVQKASEELRQMHQACLQGAGPALSEEEAVGPWTQEAALQAFRELGLAKAGAVRQLVSAARAAGPEGPEAQCLGAQVVAACAKAEDEVWERLWPGDAGRRRCFLPALARFAAADRRFASQRAGVERELAALAAAAGTGR